MTIQPDSWPNHLSLIVESESLDFEFDDYPKLMAVQPIHLEIIRKYAERVHQAGRLMADDPESQTEEGQRLQEEYLAVRNFSAVRTYGNSSALLMPLAYQDWSKVQFSDDGRMILHCVMHGHYRAQITNDPRDHTTIPRILKWCRLLGINTSDSTLRALVNRAIVEGMMEEFYIDRGKTKGVIPSTRCVDMYQASSCLYAALSGAYWEATKNLKEFDQIVETMKDLNPTLSDIAIISRGVANAFEEAGTDFFELMKQLRIPRVTRC